MKVDSNILFKKQLNAIQVVEQLLRVTKDNEPEEWRCSFINLLDLLKVGHYEEATSMMRHKPPETLCIWQPSAELEKKVFQVIQNLRVYKEWGNDIPLVEIGEDPQIIRAPTKKIRRVIFPPETLTMGQCRVRLCSYPTFMGHEELVLPMCVTVPYSGPAIGKFNHYIKGDFKLNDLSGTAIVGVLSGDDSARFDASSLFVGRYQDAWLEIPEICTALSQLGREYAYYCEESPAPLQDAFLRRCRFIARYCLDLPKEHIVDETTQTATASDVLSAFLVDALSHPIRDYVGDTHIYGDSEQFGCEYAIWLEKPGIVRVWTRITYVPK